MLRSTFWRFRARWERGNRGITSSPSEIEPRRRKRRRSRIIKGDRKAAAIVELALLMPTLTFLFMVTADFGRVYHDSLSLQNCARAGVLYASDPHVAHESPFDSTQEAAWADAPGLDPPPEVIERRGTDRAGREYVEVEVNYTFRSMVGFPGVPNEVNLSRIARMYEVAIVPDN